MTAWIEVSGLTKAFGGSLAVDAVDFALRPGEVVGLVGKNGAGKSTVIKMLAGIVKPDAGVLRIDGEPHSELRPRQATAVGLSFMFQELEQVPAVTVGENVLLGTPLPRRRHGTIDWGALHREAQTVLDDLGVGLDSRQPMSDSTAVQTRLVMVARAVRRRARLLVLDEPTAALTDTEIVKLHEVCRGLSAQGCSVVYVSHRLDEILSLCHRVIVMRDGRVVRDEPRERFDRASLVTEIAGPSVGARVVPVDDRQRRDLSAAAVALRAADLADDGLLRGVSFELRKGEILGIAGLAGAGRSELLRAVYGAQPGSRGSIEVDGKPVRIASPVDAVRLGIALLPEDRRHQGIFSEKSVMFNLTISTLDRLRGRLPGFPRRARERALTEEMVALLGVKVASPDQAIAGLSGGNQQKIVLGRWVSRESSILLLDEPVAGIDVAGKASVYEHVVRLAERGRSIVLVSSEFEELEEFCDRVLVLREGRIVAELVGQQATEKTMLEHCYGHLEAEAMADTACVS